MARTRKTIKAGDLDPETEVTVGDPDDFTDAPKPPPDTSHGEVWEGTVWDEGMRRTWPPRKRVKAWVSPVRAESIAQALNLAEADRAAQAEEHVAKYYVAVRVKMARSLMNEGDRDPDEG